MLTDIVINMRATHRSQANKLSLKKWNDTKCVGLNNTRTKSTRRKKKLFFHLQGEPGKQRKVPFAFEHDLISKFNLVRLILLFWMVCVRRTFESASIWLNIIGLSRNMCKWEVFAIPVCLLSFAVEPGKPNVHVSMFDAAYSEHLLSLRHFRK